ncbi:NifB/NifX family molybdenum-iron cluster-binding protein [Gemmatimonadota bacterium]
MNRIALTVGSPSFDVEVEPRFGRSAFILLVDPETMAWETLANPGWDARGGAGVRVAQVLSDQEVSDVVSGDFGPNAHKALDAAGIIMHRCESGTTARAAVDLWKAGELLGVGAPSRRRHRGRGR